MSAIGSNAARLRQFDADAFAASIGLEPRFEDYCSRARQNFNLRQLKRYPGPNILEVGCGGDLLFKRAIAEGLDFDRWLVIEPARAFADLCRERSRDDSRVDVVELCCEDAANGPQAASLPRFDVIIVSGVLHHVADPAVVLRAAASFGRRGARVLVTVPNAWSFHRLLAVQMGLVETVHSLVERNRRLQHARVFDPESLRGLLTECGISGLEFEGYMFKPFAHEQMEQMLAMLPAGASSGLEELGRQFPANAAEIAYTGLKA